MKKKTKKQKSASFSKRNMLITGSATAATAASFLIAMPTLAASNSSAQPRQHAGYYQHFSGTATSTAFEELHQARTQNAAFGVIAKIDGPVITLSHRTKNGMSNVMITTTDATTYKKNGQPDTVSDLAVGQRIVAMGVKDGAGNISDATSVNIFVPRANSNSN